MTEGGKDESVRPQDGLFAKRTLVLNGELTSENCSRVGRQLIALQQLSSDPISLIIDSGGGSTYAALQLCDLMESFITAEIRGVALGMCGSAATFVMLYCNKRVGTKHSRFLIHSGSFSGARVTIGEASVRQIEDLLKDVKSTEEIVTQLYAERLTPKDTSQFDTKTKKREYIRKLLARGDQDFNELMTAEEAVEVGLITEITKGNLGIYI